MFREYSTVTTKNIATDFPAPEDTPAVQHALDLAAKGFLVHRLRIEPAESKKAALRDFANRASSNPALVAKMFYGYPRVNVGYVTGSRSRMVVLDCDPRHDGHAGLAALTALVGPLPDTWQVRSGNEGDHWIYGLAEGIASPQHVTSLWGMGVQILGEGHNVVAPPSIHPDTRQPYTWDPEHNPWTMPCTPAPTWMTDLAQLAELQRVLTAKRPTPQRGSHGADRGKGKMFSSSFLESEKANASDTPLGGQDSSLHGPTPTGKLTAADVATLLLDSAQPVCDFLMKVSGRAPVKIGKSFSALFREGDKNPSAAFMPAKGPYPVLYFDHGDLEKAKSLPEVYYRILNGFWSGTMKPSTFLIWAVRLLVDSGVVAAPSLSFPTLPASTPGKTAVAYTGFQLLQRCRALLARTPGEDPEDTAYSEAFCATWCQITQREAHEALMFLSSFGYLDFTRWRKTLAFFTRGTRRLIQKLANNPLYTCQAKAIKANEAAQRAVASEAAPLRRAGQGEALVCPHGNDTWAPCPLCEPATGTESDYGGGVALVPG